MTAKNRVPCTYGDCNRLFSSVKDMQKHKTNDTRHDYCPRCDEDFGNEESLLIHKIKSTKHIVCPICGEEFRSEGGRDVHLRQVSTNPTS
jgi:Zn-finger nucleic acid-binding protein